MKVFKLFGLSALLLMSAALFTSAIAQVASPTPLDPGTFISQAVSSFQNFGTLAWGAKIAVIITILISSMKVTFLDDLIWNKLGPAVQIWVAPILGLLAGIFLPLLSGSAFQWSTLFAYVGAGMGAMYLHEILDLVKAIPGIGPFWVGAISAVEEVLGGNPVSPAVKS